MEALKRYPICEWPEDERPRERLIQFGADSLSDAQLIAILIRVGDKSAGMSAIDLARELLKRSDGVLGIESMSVSEICQIKGIGPAKTAQIKAGIEIGRRIKAGGERLKGQFTGSKDVAGYYLPKFKSAKKESFRAVLLNAKNVIIKEVVISEGTQTASLVHPREVFNPAIKDSAVSIILIHNHPSGDPSPSREDHELTKRLIQCGELVGIAVLDHVIIGDEKYFSFLDEGLIRA